MSSYPPFGYPPYPAATTPPGPVPMNRWPPRRVSELVVGLVSLLAGGLALLITGYAGLSMLIIGDAMHNPRLYPKVTHATSLAFWAAVLTMVAAAALIPPWSRAGPRGRRVGWPLVALGCLALGYAGYRFYRFWQLNDRYGW